MPFFDGGGEISGDGAAGDFVFESEFFAAGQGLDANPAIAELAVAAGLLLVAALDVGSAADGFAIRNFGSVQFHVDAVALLQAADDDFHVLLAAARQQEFLGLGIAVEAQGFVFFENFLDGVAHAVFVVAGFGGDRVGDRGFGQLYGRKRDGRRFVVDGVAGQGLLEFGYAAQVSGVNFSDGGHGFAE